MQGLRACYYNLASAKGDYSICEQAGDEADGCYDLFSSQWGDTSHCDKIKNPETRAKCKSRG